MTPPSGMTTHPSFVAKLRDRNDRESWALFHKHYGEMLYGYARRLGAPHELAEDVVQEVELYVFRAMPRFRHQSRRGCFRSYLRSAVVHALMRQRQVEGRHGVPWEPKALETLANIDPLDDPIWQRERYLDRLRWALRSMIKEFQPSTIEAFRLVAIAGRPCAEVASMLEISQASVYQAKSRVLKRLREQLGVPAVDEKPKDRAQ